jgi:hypothetical protein
MILLEYAPGAYQIIEFWRNTSQTIAPFPHCVQYVSLLHQFSYVIQARYTVNLVE